MNQNLKDKSVHCFKTNIKGAHTFYPNRAEHRPLGAFPLVS